MNNMNFLTKLTPRERVIASVTGMLLFLMFGYHGVWRPMTAHFSELNDEIFVMQMKLRKAHVFLKQRDAISEEAKKYPNLAQMDARKDEEEIASLLNFIENEARSAQVNLSDVKPQQVNQDRTAKRYVVELTAESGIKELITFIHRLQYSPQMLRIEKVDSAPKDEKSGTLRTSLIVNRVVVK